MAKKDSSMIDLVLGGIGLYLLFKTANKQSINGVIDLKELDQYTTLCRDGTYSKSKGKNACSWHGGVDQLEQKISFTDRNIVAHPSAVYLIPLKDISFDRSLFQNRESEFSEESVQRIISAVKNNTFRFEVFDPILLWQRPDKKLIVLSGHSRTEAFTRLSKEGYSDFNAIPAKIINVSLSEAKKIALESNTLQTKETDTERALYYMQLRQSGVSEKEISEAAKNNEGNNARRILSFSFLNPRGKAFFALRSLEGKDDTSQENVKNVANWIGNARMKFGVLSNLHEDEIFDWLVNGAYGRQYTNMRDFLQKLESVILQRSEFGRLNPDLKLNIANMSILTFGEKQYNAQKQELVQTIKDIEKKYKSTIQRLNQNQASEKDKNRILTPLEMQLRTARQKLIDFEQKQTRPAQAAKQELNLFAVSGIAFLNL